MWRFKIFILSSTFEVKLGTQGGFIASVASLILLILSLSLYNEAEGMEYNEVE